MKFEIFLEFTQNHLNWTDFIKIEIYAPFDNQYFLFIWGERVDAILKYQEFNVIKHWGGPSAVQEFSRN